MKKDIVLMIAKEVKIKIGDVGNLIEVPPKEELGDYAFPCFGLAKNLKKNPVVIAEDLAKKLRKKLPRWVSNVDSSGGYVNFFFVK